MTPTLSSPARRALPPRTPRGFYRLVAVAALAPLFLSAFLAAGVAADAAESGGEDQPTKLGPRAFGFDIPMGEIVPGGGRRVTTLDDDGKEVVARVHVEVAGAYIAMLPTGKLVARTKGEARPTDDEFVPATIDEMATRLTSLELKGFKVKKGRRYVFLYNCSDTFAEGTSRIMETMFPGLVNYLRSMGLKPREPEVPLVVVMFRTKDEFQNFKQVPPGMVAYYNGVENHIIMYEQSGLARVKPELAIRQKIAMIAHENVHQILHNVGIQQRLSLWPQWFGEGLAEFFAPTETDKRMRWKGAGKVNDLRMYELERYLKARDSQAPDGQLIDHTVLAARLSSTGYATSWALVHYLARYERTRFAKYFQQLSETPPLSGAVNIVKPGIVPENKKQFTETFGDDFADLEKRLVVHLKRLPYTPPFGDLPHFVATIALAKPTRTSRAANVFLSKEIAVHWVKETLEKVDEEQRKGAKATLSQHVNRAAAERYAAQWLRGR